MKRALYSIPMLGFGVVSVGCQDPVEGDFNVRFFDGTGVPYSYSYTDPDTNAKCTESVSVSTMTVDKDLLATITVNYTYVCDDGSANEQDTYVYTGTFEVIERGFTYKITLVNGDTQLTLDCSMNEAGVLFCDDDGTAFVFEPL